MCPTQVEKNVTAVSKALIKVGRFFDANGLDGCSKIASCVKQQVRYLERQLNRGAELFGNTYCLT